MLRIGARRAALSPRSRPPWHPLRNWATSAEPGFWCDLSDFSILYQDHAGTVPVASSQYVRLALDKSGRGNNWSALLDADRPQATVTNGIPYLKFNGSDDDMQTGSVTLGSDMYVIMAIRRDTTSRGMLLHAGNAGTQYLGQMEDSSILASSGAGTPTYMVDGVAVPGGTAVTESQLKTAMTPYVWHVVEICNADLSGWTTVRHGGWSVLQTPAGVAHIVACPMGDEDRRAKNRKWFGEEVGLSL